MTSYYATNGGPLAPPRAAVTSSAPSTTSHFVSRSTELLSCARTSLKLLQSQPQTLQTEWLMSISPQQLQLHRDNAHPTTELQTILEDGLSLLREMEKGLSRLQSLVRRRGHTNDPTREIASVMRQFELDAKELAELGVTIGRTAERARPQTRKHLGFIVAWLQAVAAQQTSRMKDLLQVRGNVLADQAQRRKRLQPQVGKRTVAAGTSTASSSRDARRLSSSVPARNGGGTPFDSPLFTVTDTPPSMNGGSRRPAGAPDARSTRPTSATVSHAAASVVPASNGGMGTAATTWSSSYYRRTVNGGYNGSNVVSGGYGGGGYGGDDGMGIRQRRPTTVTDYSGDAATIQAQIQERQQRRETQSRLESSRQVEQSLSHLTTMFGKMSSLIVQQGEVIDKVEDDVEAALVDVTAGHEEVTNLYSLKKGNRMLIIKVFAVLIFFILFMRLY